MRRTTIAAVALAVAVIVTTSRTAAAQVRVATPSATLFEATPYAGYLLAGSIISGPLGSAVGPAPALLVGTQLGMRIAPNISLIGNIATGNSDVKAGIPLLGGISVAQSRVVLYDAGLQLDMPMSSATGMSVSPFVQAGVGGMRYDFTQSFLTTTSNSLAGNLGLGADIGVGSGVGVRLMARDYISRLDAAEATMLDLSTDVTQNYALTVGVRFSF